MVKVGGFRTEDVQKLLKDKFVVIIGSSTQRGIYKDLIYLLNCDSLLSSKALKAKGESTFCGDDLLEGGVKDKDGLHNGINYSEVRQYKTETHHVKFYFVTRCLNTSVVSIFEEFKQAPFPDVVIMNSGLWDLCRYGPRLEAMQDYKVKFRQLMALCVQTLPADCLFLWNTTLPVASTAHGGVLVPEVMSCTSVLPHDICQANAHAIQIVRDQGFGVVDLHSLFRDHLWLQAKDGIHWCAYAHRHFTNIILKHVSEAWGVPSPPVEEISRDDMEKLRDGLVASAVPAAHRRQPVPFPQDLKNKETSRPGLYDMIRNCWDADVPFDTECSTVDSWDSDLPSNRPYIEPFDRPYIKPFGRPYVEPSDRLYIESFGRPYIEPFDRPCNKPFDRPYTEPFDRPKNEPFDRPYIEPSGGPCNKPFGRPYIEPFDRPCDGSFGRSHSEWSTAEFWDQSGAVAPSCSAHLSFHGLNPIPPQPEPSFNPFGQRAPSTHLIRGRSQSELVERAAPRHPVRMVSRGSEYRHVQRKPYISQVRMGRQKRFLRRLEQRKLRKRLRTLQTQGNFVVPWNGRASLQRPDNLSTPPVLYSKTLPRQVLADTDTCLARSKGSYKKSDSSLPVSGHKTSNRSQPLSDHTNSDSSLPVSGHKTSGGSQPFSDHTSSSSSLPVNGHENVNKYLPCKNEAKILKGFHDALDHCIDHTNFGRDDDIVNIPPHDQNSFPDMHFDRDFSCACDGNHLSPSDHSCETVTLSSSSSQDIDSPCTSFGSPVIISSQSELSSSSRDISSPRPSFDSADITCSESNELPLSALPQDNSSPCVSLGSPITISSKSNEYC